MLNDPSMKEVLKEFCKESNDLLEELEEKLEILEDEPNNTKEMEAFGQMIDRMMGAAKTMEANEVATYCELGKIISYKASQTDDTKLLHIVVNVLFNEVGILRKMISNLETGDIKPLKDLNTKAFISRLRWLSDKFKHIERSSVAVGVGVGGVNTEEVPKTPVENIGQDQIDNMSKEELANLSEEDLDKLSDEQLDKLLNQLEDDDEEYEDDDEYEDEDEYEEEEE